MDDKVEKIGLCMTCKVAYREPDLGWKILQEEEVTDK